MLKSCVRKGLVGKKKQKIPIPDVESHCGRCDLLARPSGELSTCAAEPLRSHGLRDPLYGLTVLRLCTNTGIRTARAKRPNGIMTFRQRRRAAARRTSVVVAANTRPGRGRFFSVRTTHASGTYAVSHPLASRRPKTGIDGALGPKRPRPVGDDGEKTSGRRPPFYPSDTS